MGSVFVWISRGGFIHGLLIDAEDFIDHLRVQFQGIAKVRSFGHLLKVCAAAYSGCIGRKREAGCGNYREYWLLYHMHQVNVDFEESNRCFQAEFNRIENLMIIREPVQHLHSWIRTAVIKEKWGVRNGKEGIFTHILRSEMGIILRNSGIKNVTVVRFEDLKYRTEKILKSLCKWLGIPYLDVLLSTTENGIEVYFPSYSENGVCYITGNDTTAADRKDFSDVFTVWDEARLNTIYAKFKSAYGYENDVPAFTEFSQEFLKQMLEADFKFASIVQEAAEGWTDVNAYVKNMYLDYMCNYEEGTRYYGYIRPENG